MNKSTLQRKITSLAKAATKVHIYTDEIYNWCEEEFGFTPSDVDLDEFLDTIGYCGEAEGMDVNEFLELMENEKSRH